jgi:hypothetical protein
LLEAALAEALVADTAGMRDVVVVGSRGLAVVDTVADTAVGAAEDDCIAAVQTDVLGSAVSAVFVVRVAVAGALVAHS